MRDRGDRACFGEEDGVSGGGSVGVLRGGLDASEGDFDQFVGPGWDRSFWSAQERRDHVWGEADVKDGEADTRLGRPWRAQGVADAEMEQIARVDVV